MKKSIYEKFKDFKNRYGLTNAKIAEIANEYADTCLDLARTHFTEKYEISEYVFYKARDYAIVFCLVDNKTYKKIKEKSSTNYRNSNDKNSAAASIAHFDELLSQRNEFLNDFSEKEILDIGQKYIDGVSKKNIALAYGTGEYGISNLLKKGIVNLIFDSNTVKQIHIIVGHSLDNILQQRESNKKVLLKCIENKITFLKSQIACYNLYSTVFKAESLESLQQDLSDAINMYNKALQL